MEKTALSTITLIGLVIFTTSCGVFKKSTAKSEQYSQLINTVWQLDSIKDFTKENTDKPVTIVFMDSSKRIGGNGGCNSFGGDYTIKGSSLKLDKILSTMMACNPGMRTEKAYFKALNGIDTYKIVNNKLQLLQNGKVMLWYSKQSK